MAMALPQTYSLAICHENSGWRSGRTISVLRCSATAVPAGSKTAISAGTFRPQRRASSEGSRRDRLIADRGLRSRPDPDDPRVARDYEERGGDRPAEGVLRGRARGAAEVLFVIGRYRQYSAAGLPGMGCNELGFMRRWSRCAIAQPHLI